MFLQEHFSDSKLAKCSYRNTSPETRGAERCCGNTLRTQARPRSHDTRPGLAAAEDFGPTVPTGTLLRDWQLRLTRRESSQKQELIGGNVPAGTSVPLGRLCAVTVQLEKCSCRNTVEN